MKIDAYPLPNGGENGAAAIAVYLHFDPAQLSRRLTLDEAISAHDALGLAIERLDGIPQRTRGGADPREQERFYRARLAVRLGLPADDIRAVFDLSEADLARLVAEVGK